MFLRTQTYTAPLCVGSEKKGFEQELQRERVPELSSYIILILLDFLFFWVNDFILFFGKG